MKHILLPTDFSDNARNAIVYAIQLFGNTDVEYTLLNTFVEPNMGTGAMISLRDVLHKESLEGLAKDLKFINDRFPDMELKIQRRSEYGSLPRVINFIAKDETFDFVVMGTKGETAGRWLMGSVAKSTIQDVNVPVIVIPEEAEYKSISKIVYATSLHEDETGLIKQITNLAEAYEASVTILHVDNTVSTRAQNKLTMLEIMKENGYPKMDHKELIQFNVEDAIIDYTEEYHTDLLAMTTYTTGLLKKLFHKSVTNQLLLHTQIPMLVFNRK